MPAKFMELKVIYNCYYRIQEYMYMNIRYDYNTRSIDRLRKTHLLSVNISYESFLNVTLKIIQY